MSEMSEKKKKRVVKNEKKDKSYKRFVYNRVYTCIFLAFVQISAWLVFLFVVEHEAIPALKWLIWTLAAVFVVYLVNRPDEDSGAKLKWIIIILLFPIIGVFLFLAYGEGRPTKKINAKYVKSWKENEKYLIQSDQTSSKIEAGGREAEVCNYLKDKAGYPAFTDGTVDYYPMGAELFEEMMKEVERAEKFILVEYFIVGCGKMWDRLREALLRKAEQGVKVYIIYDDFGSVLVLPRSYYKYLNTLHPNLKSMAFNYVLPLFAMHQNNRDHRKMFVIDNKVAFTGGLNIADEYIGEKERFGVWKDTGLKITGGAVEPFVVMFFNLWNAFNPKDRVEVSELLGTVEEHKKVLLKKQETDGLERGERNGFFVQPFDDSPYDRRSDGEFVYLDIIERASDYVYIFTPYLVITDGIRTALCRAAQRGVDVRIVTPAIPDKKMVFRITRANYGILMEHGVKIYEYTPGFMHAKSIVSDDKCAVVGSINFDYRSFYLHFENAVYFSDAEAVKKVREDAERTFEESALQTPETIKRSWLGHLIDSFLRFMDTVV
jgi:cardiolipin synthase